MPRRDSAFAVVILLHWFVKEILEILHCTRKKKDEKFSIFLELELFLSLVRRSRDFLSGCAGTVLSQNATIYLQTTSAPGFFPSANV